MRLYKFFGLLGYYAVWGNLKIEVSGVPMDPISKSQAVKQKTEEFKSLKTSTCFGIFVPSSGSSHNKFKTC